MLRQWAVNILAVAVVALGIALFATLYLLKKSHADNAILTTNNATLAEALDDTKATMAEEREQNRKDRIAIQSAAQAQAQITHEKAEHKERLNNLVDESKCINANYPSNISSMFPGTGRNRAADTLPVPAE